MTWKDVGKMATTQDSQDSVPSLPSPDRVANLWRYGDTPPKLKSVSVDGSGSVENLSQSESLSVEHEESGEQERGGNVSG